MASAPSLRKAGIPVTKRSNASQAAVTATVGAALATTAATNSSPYGFSQAQADGLISRVNALIVDDNAQNALLNEIRTCLVNAGLMKGS